MPVLAAVLLGGLLSLLGAVLLIPVPELGAPLLVVGLRLLGRRFQWARVSSDRIDAAARAVHARWRRLPRLVRWVLAALLLGLLVLAGYLAVRHLPV